MGNWRRAAACIAVSVAIAAGGCTGPVGDASLGGADDGSDSRAMEFDEMVQEYLTAAQELSWPVGFTYPTTVPEVAPEPNPEGELVGTVYESGYGVTIAEHYWWCAWSAEWLSTKDSDPAAAEAALSNLRRVQETYLYRKALDAHGREVFDDMVEKAGLGDAARLANYETINC